MHITMPCMMNAAPPLPFPQCWRVEWTPPTELFGKKLSDKNRTVMTHWDRIVKEQKVGGVTEPNVGGVTVKQPVSIHTLCYFM